MCSEVFCKIEQVTLPAHDCQIFGIKKEMLTLLLIYPGLLYVIICLIIKS